MEPLELRTFTDHFENKVFMRHEAQSVEQYILNNLYLTEEEVFVKNVQPVLQKDVPNDANAVYSHVVHKVKRNNDGGMKLGRRIAPHAYKDNVKYILTKDCTVCLPTCLRVVESISSLFDRKILS